MFFPSDEKWAEWGIQDESHKFFFLRWCELFDEDTFDSWQVRTSNIKSILGEILNACETVEKYHPFHSNIKWLIEEAKAILPKDIVINESFSFLSNYLDEIDKAYNDKVASQNKAIREFRQIVAITLDHMASYCDKVIKRLRRSLQDKTSLDELYVLTLNLGIELHNVGYSLEALKEGVQILTSNDEADFLRRYDKLIQRYTGRVNEYNCSFIISWPNKKPEKNPDLTSYGIELDKGHPNEGLSAEEAKFLDQDKEALIAKVKIKTVDHFSARYQVEDILESIFAVNKLYQPTGTAKIKHELALIQQEGGEVKCIPPNNGRLHYVKDSKNPDRKITDYAKLYKNLTESDKEQLSAALQYHKLFMTASADEARLTNLWIAVESLIQDGSKSIIERITTYLSATNATSFVRLLANFMPLDIKSQWRKADTTELRKKLKKSNEYILDPYDLIMILLDKEDGGLATEFEQVIGPNTYLKFRIKRLKNKTFKNAGCLRGVLENHSKNLAWQIHRIYRARNYATHSGKCFPGTRHLIQNLHSYFIIAIHNLMHDLTKNPGWSISNALEHRLLVYKYMLKRLEKNDKEPVSVEMLLDPACSLSAIVATSAWEKV